MRFLRRNTYSRPLPIFSAGLFVFRGCYHFLSGPCVGRLFAWASRLWAIEIRKNPGLLRARQLAPLFGCRAFCSSRRSVFLPGRGTGQRADGSRGRVSSPVGPEDRLRAPHRHGCSRAAPHPVLHPWVLGPVRIWRPPAQLVRPSLKKDFSFALCGSPSP